MFIQKGLLDIYSLEMRYIYKMPFYLINTSNRIVLYGAGNVGRSYYRQLSCMENIKLVGWIDKRLGNQKIYGCKIEFPDFLNKTCYDKVLIAVNSSSLAMEIKQELRKYVSEERIIWEKPIIKWWEREIDV